MATKKTTKKVAKKVLKPRVKPVKFNFDIRTEEDANTLIAHLENLKFNTGWMLMVKILESNMASLERSIITKRDPSSDTVLTELQLDALRDKLVLFEELIRKPDDLIASYKKQNAMTTPEYDPYHSDTKRIGKDTREMIQERSPSTLT